MPEYAEGEGRTLHHLLTMTSGIPNYTKDEQVRGGSNPAHEEVLAAIRGQELEFEPGER